MALHDEETECAQALCSRTNHQPPTGGVPQEDTTTRACSSGKENTPSQDGPCLVRAPAATPQHHAGASDKKPPSASLRLEELMQHVRCGLCTGPVACSLVLSCGHQFCGRCLCQSLDTQQPMPECPTCHMSLRAVPVRCLAVDSVVQMLLPFMPRNEQQAHSQRRHRGQTAADYLNKVLWWLSPTAVVPIASPPQGAGLPLSHQQAPQMPPTRQHSGPMDGLRPASQQSLHRLSSSGSDASAASMMYSTQQGHSQQHPYQLQQQDQRHQRHQNWQHQQQMLQQTPWVGHMQGTDSYGMLEEQQQQLQQLHREHMVAATAAAAAAAATTAAMQHLPLGQHLMEPADASAHAAATAAACLVTGQTSALDVLVNFQEQQRHMAAAAAAAVVMGPLHQQQYAWH